MRNRSILLTAAVAAVSLPVLMSSTADAAYSVVATGRDGLIHKYDEAGVEDLAFKANFQSYLTANSYTDMSDSVWGIAADPVNNQVWVSHLDAADGRGSTLFRVNADGTVAAAVTLTDGPNTAVFTRALDVGTDGNVYVVTDTGGGELWKVSTATNAVSRINNTNLGGSPYDVVQHADGTIYVAMWNSADGVNSFDSSGTYLGNVVPHGDYATPPQVDRSYAVDFAPDGNLYVLDGDQYFTPEASMDFLVKRFDLDPTLAVAASDIVVDGASDSNAATNRIHFGLAVGPDGRTFVTTYNPGSDYPAIASFTPGGVYQPFVTTGEFFIHVDVLAPIPEPAAASLLAVVAAGIALRRRRRA